MITIRQENKNDYKEVYNLVKTAFETAEHRDGTEQDLVERLRNSQSFIPELSLIAQEGNKIVGHILFTKIKLGDTNSITLAPLAILPEYQKKGIGTLLLNEGHRIAKDLGYEFSVVVGSENYYPRVGYQPASDFGIKSSIEVPDMNFMAMNLQGKAMKLNHVVEYPKEFF